jgi:CheY-like chemotaxis protein
MEYGPYPAIAMGLTSLLVCADAAPVQLLTRLLADLGIEVEPCGNLSLARARVNDRHFDAMLVDCLDEPAAVDLIAHVRSAPKNYESVVIALLEGPSGAGNAFAAGANFVLYKPISQERAAHCIRAACSLIRRERRVRPRIAVTAAASMDYPGKEQASAQLMDVNELGLKVRTDEKLPPSCKAYFQFTLPGEKAVIRLSGEVMWQDSAGRAGLRFASVPPSSRRVLQGWIQQHVGTVPAADSPQTKHSHPEKVTSEVFADLGTLSTPANRRDLGRKACRLSGDVYRPESSAPVRCTLTDIARGGCYVETTDPFPEGTAVEIVVRTEALKLCVVGRVKSVNRGFGMGVQFSLRNAEQQKQVDQLVQCAQVKTRVGE